ncbi:MAG: hypothetical protein HY329_27855 [Chloroflexi bacterium]|nr:hypothetical protein [Chloroflexota bacterium]
MSMPNPIGHVEFLARRELLLHRLRRLNEALVRWDEGEENAALPCELQREMAAPIVPRRTLEIARQGVMDGLLDWEEEWERRN